MPEINTPEGGRLADSLQVENLIKMRKDKTKSIMSEAQMRNNIVNLLFRYDVPATSDIDADLASLQAKIDETGQ